MFAIEPIHVVGVGIIASGVVLAYVKHTMNVMKQRKQPLKITV